MADENVKEMEAPDTVTADGGDAPSQPDTDGEPAAEGGTPQVPDTAAITAKLAELEAELQKEREAKKAAVRRMNDAAQEAAIERRRREELESARGVTAAPTGHVQPASNAPFTSGNLPDNPVIQQYAEKLGKTPEQLMAELDIYSAVVQAQLSPVIESISRSEIAALKQTLKASDKYFTPEVEEEFERELRRFPANQRTNPAVYNQALLVAKGRAMERIVENTLRNADTGSPAPTPAPSPMRPTPSPAQNKARPKKVDWENPTIKNLMNGQGWSRERIIAVYGEEA